MVTFGYGTRTDVIEGFFAGNYQKLGAVLSKCKLVAPSYH